jgi:GDP-4-dehydro-6-deoxy-D-mannose reductase
VDAPDVDVRDRRALEAAIASARPDAVFHLAARTFVPEAEASREETLAVNAGGTLAAARIVVASSGLLYASSPRPIDESGAVDAASFYALTKRLAEEIALHDAKRGAPVIVARPFNHVGPGQRAEFALASFARQIADAERGRGPASIRVGNLEAVRDFLDVRDVARAYRLLAERGRPGEVYNIGSGVGRRISEGLEALRRAARVPIEVEIDPQRLRPIDAPRIVADARKLRTETGWEPEIPFETTIRDLLESFRG